MAGMMYNTSNPFPEPFEFERIFDADNRLQWMHDNWHQSIYWSILYVIVIFGLRCFMKNCPAMELKTPLIIWNLGLALFSISGAVRMLPGFFYTINEFGFTFSTCDNKHFRKMQPFIFWGWLFLISKIVELGDTLFIVLRKRKLIFLHWYHHIMTLMTCWYSTAKLLPVIYWTAVVNCSVHSFMYTYYMLTALGIKMPKTVAMFITSIQLSQMVVLSFVSYWSIRTKWQGHQCEFSDNAVLFPLMVGLSYIFLFSRLFYNSYIAKSAKKLKKA